jgi:hypothetical protein
MAAAPPRDVPRAAPMCLRVAAIHSRAILSAPTSLTPGTSFVPLYGCTPYTFYWVLSLG